MGKVMDEEEEETRTSIFDITSYSERTRKIVFGVIAAFLIAVIALAIFVISPNAEKEQRPEPTVPPATQAPINPDPTPTAAPAENPTSEEDEFNQNQENIIENETPAPPLGEGDQDVTPDIANADALLNIAKEGVLSLCNIGPGETTEQRKAKMLPYFHEDTTEYRNPEEFYYERKCSIEGAADIDLNEAGQPYTLIGVAWSAVLSADDKAAQNGYTQYTVVLDENGIISLDD
jgi:hypothetical protein